MSKRLIDDYEFPANGDIIDQVSREQKQLDDEKEEIKRKVDIVRLFEHFGVTLQKFGRSYKGHCPWHDDKNPSLNIYPRTNKFHCFGCHKGGDAITFVRLRFGYGFRRAVEYLAGGIKDERTSIREGVRRGEKGSQARR